MFRFIFVFIVFAMNFAMAQHSAVIVKIKGEAELFVTPGSLKEKSPSVLLDGKTYEVQKVKLGTKVEPGSVVRTSGKSKLRLVYKNGDQITVGPATSYEILELNGKKSDDASSIRLMYGAIRSVISKNGPRNGMKVKTRTAAMGIRGTDFFVSQRGSAGETQVAVIRGEVNAQANAKGTKELKVKSGQTAAFEESKTKKTIESEVTQTTQEDLVKIQLSSVIKKSEENKEVVAKSVAVELKALEKKATENAIEDIKNYDKNLYQKLKKANIASMDTVNTVSVKKAFYKAPKGKSKISGEELEEIQMNAYEEYFKIDEINKALE